MRLKQNARSKHVTRSIPLLIALHYSKQITAAANLADGMNVG